jgi:nucleoside-diphosphate-sugar epimerase
MIKENVMADSNTPTRLLVYGGNGFVGSKVLELAAIRGAICTSVSRSGKMPAQLQQLRPLWLNQVTWVVGDALHPDPSLVASADVIVCLVGSPPLPTFNQRAFEQQVMTNGSANTAVIAEAQRQGVKRLVLLSAHIPALMRSSRFGYYVGKQQACEAAADYTRASADNAATVIYPSAIYGTRYTGGGTAIPLGLFMSPVAWVMRCLPVVVSQFLPESPVRVQQVASSVVDAAMAVDSRGLLVVENQDLLAV